MTKEKNNTIPYRRHLISLVCVAIISAGGTYQYTEIQQERRRVAEEESFPHAVDLTKLNATYETIISEYIGDYDKNELVNGAIRGMTGALDDPYSDYFTGEDSKKLSELIDGSFEGIGATMTTIDSLPTIAEPPIKGSPAERAKLQPDDVILKVDGKSTKGRELTEVVSEIRGKKGTKVTLTIQRKEATFDVTLERDVIPQVSVYTEVDPKDHKIGLISVTQFTEETAKEFQQGIEALRQKKVTSFIIDVRQNPGGLLDQVAIMSSMFLKDGQTIVKFEDKQKNKEQLVAGKKLDKGFKVDEPTVVLVNENSASASEIFAAALNESANIKVIGTTTFGKGTVQSVNKVGTDSDLKLTTSKWLTPKGEWINEKGFKPTIEIELLDYQLAMPIDRSTVYQLEATGQAVKNINLILSGLDYQVDKGSEEFTKATELAVEEFQAATKLVVSGQVDDNTATELERALAKKIVAQDAAYDLAVKELSK